MVRWGWGGAAVLTVVGLVGVRIAGHVLPPYATATVIYGWLAYVVYSWVWPSILKKLI
jgi:hypothetical protein